MTLVLSIDCQSGSIGGEQREARIETTVTGVKWTISGKLETAVRELFANSAEQHREAWAASDYQGGFNDACNTIASVIRKGAA